jgi:hypothetical protein
MLAAFSAVRAGRVSKLVKKKKNTMVHTILHVYGESFSLIDFPVAFRNMNVRVESRPARGVAERWSLTKTS